MAPQRYRCTACGNITRFDVVTDKRSRAFHHFSVGGALSLEEEEVIFEQVVEVTCRWCGHGRAVEAVDDPVTSLVGQVAASDRPDRAERGDDGHAAEPEEPEPCPETGGAGAR
ncbi:MAG: hypothetical protein ACRDV4_05605 [Acidimicrobiales bacterium]